MRNKLRDSRGETLAEVFASILIAALSVGMLFGGIVTAVRTDSAARELDTDYFQALSAAESQTGAAEEGFSVRIQGGAGGVRTVAVELYGGGGLYSYREAP